MDLPAADYGRVLNKIQPFHAALPFIIQQPAIQHTARPSLRVCPTCLIQSHLHSKRRPIVLSAHLQNPS